MKKILGLFFFLTLLGIAACDNNDPEPGPPTLTIDPSTAQNIPGTSVIIKATISAPAGAKTLSVSGGSTQNITLDGSKNTFDKDVTIDIPADAAVGSTISAVFILTDNKNQNSSPATATVTVGDPVVQLTGNIDANMTLVAATPYLLKGQVFVKPGATLTIPAGTVIKGDKVSKAVLIIEPGGKLICNGTQENPVVFTSAQPVNGRDRGDWGGIIILGNAWVNQETKPSIEGISPSVAYGSSKAESATPTTNANENSGTLTYVRIEYAGIELTPNNETNSLTFGAVGNGTTVHHIQVSYGGDDAYEWFGGTVNAKHLVSFSTWDDDFDTDFGYSGNVQFGLSVRYPFFADQSGSNAFESDNQGNANATNGCDFTVSAGQVTGGGSEGCTKAVFSNMTVLGPKDYSARSVSGNFQNAMHVRRRTTISILNSVIAGFPTGLRVDDDATIAAYNSGLGVLSNNVLLVPSTKEVGTTSGENNVAYSTNTSSGDATNVISIWMKDGSLNSIYKPVVGALWSATPGTPAGSVTPPYADLGIDPAIFWGGSAVGGYPANPSLAISTGTIPTAADFTNAKVTAEFFEKVDYIGAFGSEDWTDSWTEFQPLTVAY
jgi:hypothetical protein